MDPRREESHGRYVLFAIATYALWGLIPLYFKTVAQVAPLELLAHRAAWSFVTLLLLSVVLGRRQEVWDKLCNRRIALMMLLSGTLIACNWLTFIYAVLRDQVLQASLGHFLGPLGYVFLGILFLRERLRPFQWLAVGLAAAGFLVLAVMAGQMPWLALSLAMTAGLHLLLRKTAPVDGFISLVLETLILTPVALGYLGYLASASQLTGNTPGLLGLLMLSGPVTSVPFLFFGAAAKRLRLSTMGIIHYLMPTIQFFLAVFIFKEPFSTARLLGFACVWAAVAIYTADSYRASQEIPVDPID